MRVTIKMETGMAKSKLYRKKTIKIDPEDITEEVTHDQIRSPHSTG